MSPHRIVILGSLALLLGGCTISNPLKYYSKAYKERPYDVVIVPGIPFENGTWGRTMQGRLLWAVYLYEQGVTKNIITSGSAVYSPYVEGEIMRKYVIAMGVPAENVFAEPRAEHSTENLFYGWKLARSLNFKQIGLATDRFQSKMLKKFNRKMHRRLGSTVDIIPMVEDTVGTLDQTTPTIDPSSAFVKDFVPITERESRWKRFRGTLGYHLDWKAD